jgi:hypothetical protein
MTRELETTYQKYEEKKTLLEQPTRLFHSLLQRTLNHFIAGTEIGGPEAASLLLGFDDHYTGHEFVPIDWKAFDLHVCHSLPDYEGFMYSKLSQATATYNHILTVGQNTADSVLDEQLAIAHSNIDDYIHRGNALESRFLWEFTSYYRFTTLGDDDYGQFVRFRESHPIWKAFDNSGSVKKKYQQFPTLPWFNALSSIHGVGTEAFSRIMCILFIPFRTSQDLLPLGVINFQERHTQFKIGKSKSQYPYSVLFNIEYNALNSKEAHNFTTETLVATGNDIIRGLSNEHQATQAEAALNTDGWEEFQFHIPVTPHDRPRTFCSINQIEFMIRNIDRLNQEKQSILFENNTERVYGSHSDATTLENYSSYCAFVKTFKSEGNFYS